MGSHDSDQRVERLPDVLARKLVNGTSIGQAEAPAGEPSRGFFYSDETLEFFDAHPTLVVCEYLN